MTRSRRGSAEPPGHDSFLDIVANLVGILVILIIVIGAQAADAMIERQETVDPESIDVQGPQQAAASLESDIHALAKRLARQQLEIAYRQKERERMHFALTALEQGLQEKRSQLSQSQREQVELQEELRMAEDRLLQIEQAKLSVQNAQPSTKILEHLPTPMAKTVFGQELHFRLHKGRIAYVPWEELVERLRKEAPEKAWKLKSAPELTETIGPLHDFWLNYTLHKSTIRVPTGSGYSLSQAMELHHFTLVPVRDELGDLVQEALRPDSSFRARLEMYNPNRTTVTVWVYPNSFQHFRTIKAELYKLGFLCAGRPMPDGFPIGGSPSGTRSAAQ